MKDWEFLMQKEGDRYWLSLPTSTQEIEAGKYRIVAHTRRANVAVDITVTYQNASSYHYRQHRYTNSEGLTIIIPWTDLRPGVWRISCCCDIMGELLGEFWKKSLQINVLPATAPSIVLPQKNPEQGSPSSEDFANDDDIADHSNSPPFALIDYFQNLEPQLIAPPPEETTEPELTLTLTLDQNTLLREPGSPVAISGQIDLLGDDSSWELVEGTLRYQLRDPKTGQVLLDLEQRLSEQSLPLTFSYSLELLPEWESCLLLGEVILEVPLEVDGSEIRIPVANQSFTITASLEELLKSVQVLEHCRSVAQTRPDSTQLSEGSISLFDPRKSRANRIRQFRPSSGQILPPRISNATTKKDQPQLPKFSVLKSATPAPLQSRTIEESSSSEILSSHQARGTTAVLANFDGATVSDRAAVDRDFEALKPQERFWSRLNSLTSESASNNSESSSIEESTEEPSRE